MKGINRFVRDNKGSGIMTVMLAVLFLTAFGSLALYLTYTSFQVAASDRISKEITYNANTCMEEVKAGIQDIVSDSIEETYRDIMPEYIISHGDVTERFANAYFSNIYNWGLADHKNLFTLIYNDVTGMYENGTYSSAALKSLIKEKRGYDCDVTGSIDDSTGRAVVNYRTDPETNKKLPESIVLEGIKVTYVGKGGRKSSVTADIKIGVPNIGYLLTQYSISGIPEFAMICTNTLYQKGVSGSNKEAVINSNAYVGNIVLEDDTALKIGQNSTLICKGNISVNGTYGLTNEDKQGRFMVDRNSTLWAGNIEIGPASSVRLLGNTYMANDLVFNGYNADAYLRGNYFGFGSSTVDASKSSSIISNKTGGKINMQFLDELTLAGVSFITNEDKSNLISTDSLNSDIRMGESISGKNNQQLYFAPFGSVVCYKPEKIFDSDDDYDYFLNDTGHYIEHKRSDNTNKYFVFVKDSEGHDTNEKQYLPNEDYNPVCYSAPFDAGQSMETLLTAEEFYEIDHFSLTGEDIPDLPGKKFADYGIDLRPLYKWYDEDTVVVFFFLKFDSQVNANQYFIDCFNASINGSSSKNITKWLDAFILNETKNSLFGHFRRTTTGSFYTDFDSSHRFLNPVTLDESSINELIDRAEFVERIFNNYCKTLTNVVVDTDAQTPFDYYIHKSRSDAGDRAGILDLLSENQTMNFYTRDKLTAVVARGDYTYTGGNPDICLIIATGDVNVLASFNGLIICDGNIYIKDKVTLTNSSDKILAAFKSADSSPDTLSGGSYTTVVGDYALKDFFNIDILEQYENSESKDGDAWNVASLVTFDKWSRD